jgi:DNA-binding PadR family transcriptional regulator
MPARPLNATAASLLGFLHDGPMTGWDLMATAQRRIGGFWSLTRSQVYRELTTLADGGLVEAGEVGPRDRRPYSLTAQGRAAFAEWIRRDPGSETIRFPLLLTVGFGRHLAPEELAAILTRHRATHEQRLASYLEVAGRRGEHTDPFVHATLQFGIAYERAVLEWFDALPSAFTTAADEPGEPHTPRGPGRG